MSFMNEIKKATNITVTKNGDKAYKSTFNANLDFFGGQLHKEDGKLL